MWFQIRFFIKQLSNLIFSSLSKRNISDVDGDITAAEEEKRVLLENPRNVQRLPFDSSFIDLISHP